jgi:hypothetical protein
LGEKEEEEEEKLEAWVGVLIHQRQVLGYSGGLGESAE